MARTVLPSCLYDDGKFILELSHRRDGEKMSWIPVPKKTYWPPPVTTSTVTNSLRQESTASLSVSDDNSSVQLSPWQRDHCWKQTSPRKALSHDMTFVMIPFPRAFHVRKANSLTIKRMRRRPFDPIEKVINWKTLTILNGYQRPVKLKNCAIKNGGLNTLVQRLWDYSLKSSESAQTVQKLSPSMFSPRKRILREFERVSLVGTGTLEDSSQVNLKRHRPKTTVAVNGQSPTQGNSKGVSSYSITSLLAGKEEEHQQQDQEPSFLRTLLRSPKDEASPEPSPKSRRNSPSQSLQSSPPPPAPPPSGDAALTRNAPYPSVQFPYLHSPLLYPHFLPQSPAAHHSYYGMPSSFRGSAPAIWGVPYHHHPHVSSPLHGGSYHGLVSPYSSSQYTFWPGQPPLNEFKGEDATSGIMYLLPSVLVFDDWLAYWNIFPRIPTTVIAKVWPHEIKV
ncbi:hypothetical protein RUM43_007970, partial [Polyplax serrata]